MTNLCARVLRTGAVVTALALLAVGSAATPAFGAANDVFSVEPSAPEGSEQRPWFVYNLAPGQIFQDSVDVENFSDEDLTLALYTTDGVTLPGAGGFAPLREGDESVDAGLWLTLPIEEITLGPLEGATIPFQIEVPLDAEPGDHAAVIVASDPEGSVGEGGGDLTVELRNRVGARMYVRVAGPLEPSVRVDDITIEHNRPVNPLTGGTATITYVVSNTGNIRLSEDIQVKVNGIFGRNLVTLPPRNFPDVLPGGAIVVTEVVEDLSAWEPLSAEVTVTAREASANRTKTFYPIPWPTVIVILLVIGAVLAWWLRRRRRGAEDDTFDDPGEGPDDAQRELVEAGT